MNEPKPEEKPYAQIDRRKENSLDANLIADMLRIEAITTELREFKTDTKARFDKLEGWFVAIIGITVTTLLATVGALVLKLIE